MATLEYYDLLYQAQMLEYEILTTTKFGHEDLSKRLKQAKSLLARFNCLDKNGDHNYFDRLAALKYLIKLVGTESYSRGADSYPVFFAKYIKQIEHRYDNNGVSSPDIRQYIPLGPGLIYQRSGGTLVTSLLYPGAIQRAHSHDDRKETTCFCKGTTLYVWTGGCMQEYEMSSGSFANLETGTHHNLTNTTEEPSLNLTLCQPSDPRNRREGNDILPFGKVQFRQMNEKLRMSINVGFDKKSPYGVEVRRMQQDEEITITGNPNSIGYVLDGKFQIIQGWDSDILQAREAVITSTTIPIIKLMCTTQTGSIYLAKDQ